jgi:hypothetical protein
MRAIRPGLVLLLALAAAFLSSRPGPASAGGSDPVLVGAGDIASCASSGDEATADLLDEIAGTVATFGDNAYPSGTESEFADCYQPTWGRHKARTRPATGNHDYTTSGASGYFGYFGAAAGDPSKGYYSYDLGAWHVIAINSNCSQVGGCDAGSPQEQWLRADLAESPTSCTLAYWHHPRFSSGLHGNQAFMQAIWQALYDYGADVVLSGHDHFYERFALQDPGGAADPTGGIRQFTVGTGGRSHHSIATPIANSEVQNDDTFGVLKLTLHATSYEWEFVPEAGGAFSDSGSASCVGPAVGGIAEVAQAEGAPLVVPPPPEPHFHTAVPIEPTPIPPPPTDTPTATSTPTTTPSITPTATPADPATADSQGDGGFPWLPVLGGVLGGLVVVGAAGFAVRRGRGFWVPWRKRP